MPTKSITAERCAVPEDEAAIIAYVEEMAAAWLSLGSSQSHTSPLLLNAPTATWAKGGHFVALHGNPGTGTGGGGPRGPVKCLSRAAARRIMQYTSELDWQREKWRPLFLTLTYPRPAPSDRETIKRHLDTFWKRLQRRWPHAGAVWCLEAQADGTPHYHLIVFGVAFMPWAWLAANWDAIIGNDVTPEASASTQVQRVRSRKGAMWYIRKYLAKTEQGEALWGRRWGVLGEESLPRLVVETALELYQFHRLRRWLRAFQRSQGYHGRPLRGAKVGLSAFLGGDAFEALLRAALGP